VYYFEKKLFKMLNNLLKYSSVIVLAVNIVACNSNNNPDVSDIKIDLSIRRFERELFAVANKASMQTLLNNNENYVKSLYRTFADDTAFVSHLYYLVKHPGTQKFYNETQTKFGDLENLKKELESAFKHIKYYYPDFKTPKVMTTFTGLENDMFVSDTLIIIALESFIGPKATYRPDQPNYVLNRYAEQYIVPTIVRYLSNDYNKQNLGDQTFLADMVFFGKSFEFTKTMMPATPDSLIMGYSQATLDNTWAAQDQIWAHLIDKSVLYSKNPTQKEIYLGERPKVSEIGPECPGRIGQWVGWRIIGRYRTQKPDVTFESLMANANIAEIFRDSGYRGQTEEE
jgi:hypothetical protein